MPIMDSLSRIAKTVGDGAKTAYKKSEDMVEIAKLNKAITNEEDRIKLTYIEIGKVVYSKFEKNEIADSELVNLCNKVVEFQKNIINIRQKIAEIKNVKVCSKCGTEADLNSEFCIKCGEKLDSTNNAKDEAEPEPIANSKEEEYITKPKFCPYCGAKVVDNSKFCQECGEKLI